MLVRICDICKNPMEQAADKLYGRVKYQGNPFIMLHINVKFERVKLNEEDREFYADGPVDLCNSCMTKSLDNLLKLRGSVPV